MTRHPIPLFVCLFVSLLTYGAADGFAQSQLGKVSKAAKLTRGLPKTQTLTRVDRIAREAQQASRTATQAAIAANEAGKVSRLSGFVDKHQRGLMGLQTTFGVTPRKAWENLKDLGAQYHPKNPRPQLAQEASFVSADLTEFVVPPSMEVPQFPFQNQHQLIYRGMALNADGKAIRNILENGLRTQDVGKESNTLLYSMAGPNARHADIRQPLINLTDSPADAAMWAGKRLSEGQITVVTVVKSNRTGNIITESSDIPVANIYAQTALLKINDKPTWCKVELEGNGFRITPYEPTPTVE